MKNNTMMRKKTSNTFAIFGKSIGILLLFLLQNLSAQIHISEDALLYTENDESIYTSDSEKKSSEEIYVSSGATITNLEHSGKYKIIAVAKPEINNPKKVLAQKETQKIASTNSKAEKRIPNIASKKHIAFSKHSTSDISSTNSTKTVFTLVSGSTASSKIIAAFPKNNFSLNQISRKPSNIFLYSDCTISNHHLTSFSVRPPPFFT